MLNIKDNFSILRVDNVLEFIEKFHVEDLFRKLYKVDKSIELEDIEFGEIECDENIILKLLTEYKKGNGEGVWAFIESEDDLKKYNEDLCDEKIKVLIANDSVYYPGLIIYEDEIEVELRGKNRPVVDIKFLKRLEEEGREQEEEKEEEEKSTTTTTYLPCEAIDRIRSKYSDEEVIYKLFDMIGDDETITWAQELDEDEEEC